jgi:hypothetical protein
MENIARGINKMEIKFKKLKLPILIAFLLFLIPAIVGIICPSFSIKTLQEITNYFISEPTSWFSIFIHNFLLGSLMFFGGAIIIIPYLFLPFQSFLVHWAVKSSYVLNPSFSLYFSDVVVYLLEFTHYMFATSLGVYLSLFFIKNIRRRGFKKSFKSTFLSIDFLILIGLFLLSSILLVIGALIESVFLAS